MNHNTDIDTQYIEAYSPYLYEKTSEEWRLNRHISKLMVTIGASLSMGTITTVLNSRISLVKCERRRQVDDLTRVDKFN